LATFSRRLAILTLVAVLIVLPFLEYVYLPNQIESTMVGDFQSSIYRSHIGSAAIALLDQDGLPAFSTNVEVQPNALNFKLGAGVWTTTANVSWTQSDWNYYNKAGFEYEQIWTTWRLVEPKENQFDFSSIQGQIDYVRAHNPDARFFARLQGIVPDPLVGDSLNDSTPPPFTGFTSKFPLNHSTYLQEVSTYVRTLVSKYGRDIGVWITPIEINRADYAMSAFNLPNPPWNIEEAIQLDKVIADTIKQTNPAAVVALGTSLPLSQYESKDATRIDPLDFEVAAMGSKIPFDVVAVETYGFTGDLTFWTRYLGNMSSLGRPIFINEAGYSSLGFDVAKLESASDAQSFWYQGILSLALGSKDIMGLFILEFKDRTVQQRYSKFETMGLLDFSGNPKASYNTTVTLLEKLTQFHEISSEQGKVTVRVLAGNYTITAFGMKGVFGVFENQTSSYTVEPGQDGHLKISRTQTSGSQSTGRSEAGRQFTQGVTSVLLARREQIGQ
jgi:hypothetical protein